MNPTDREKALWDKLGDMDRDAWRDERGAAFIAIAAALSEARKEGAEECDKRWGRAVAEWSAVVSRHPGCEIAETIFERALKERTP